MKEKSNQAEFDSMTEFLGWIEKNPNFDDKNASKSSRRFDDRWAGASWGGALDLVRNGWHAGTADISAKLDEIKHRSEMMQVGYQWDVTGDTFDVGTMLAGEPEHWLSPDVEPVKRIYRIGVNVGVSVSVSPKQIMNKGAAVVALIDKLQEDPSAIVELDIVCMLRYGKGREFCLHMGASPLDMDGIAFAVAHPAFLRRLLFAYIEIENNRKYCGSYGMPSDIKKPDAYDLYIPCNYTGDGMSEFDTTAGAAAWVKRKVEALTAKAE